jgi:glycosyltransferase involved in cell wall biosynthesis
MVLEALAADHDVHLLIVPVARSPFDEAARVWAARWCRRSVVYRAPAHGRTRAATAQAVRGTAALFGDTAVDVVHVFRLYLAPFAAPFLERAGGPRCAIDLDDHDCETRARIALVHESAGRADLARRERVEARRAARMEATWVPRFTRAYLASDRDRRLAEARHGFANLRVLPNAVRAPAAPLARGSDARFTMLFVGTLGYAPNADAITHFCADVLPRLRGRLPAGFRVLVVGQAPVGLARALAAYPEVEVAGAVGDLTGAYAGSDVVVVPLRAGGGTRIKILEAFALGRPVVSTPAGAEGLEVEAGRHLLIGADAAAFADQCAAAAAEPALRERLVADARRLVASRYGPEAVRSALKDGAPSD